MKRNEWTFQFTTEKLAEATSAKIDFHNSRLLFWQESKEKAMKEARDNGISIAESDANHASNYTQAFTPTVMVDATIQRRITEAHSKVREHHGKVKEYEGWLQVFTANKGRTLDLTADDYLFFFGK